MFDLTARAHTSIDMSNRDDINFVNGNRFYWVAKRIFDVLSSLLLIPFFLLTAVSLLILNPWFNKGSLFYIQTRMGKDCKPFQVFKFRSMIAVTQIERGPEDPIENDRITYLGRIIRKIRLDEVPQIINILKGDMSLIGPRPDYFPHAELFSREIHGYRERHNIRPGISGLAQVKLGYIEGTEATLGKVALDLEYIHNAGFKMDLWLIYRTVITVFKGAGV